MHKNKSLQLNYNSILLNANYRPFDALNLIDILLRVLYLSREDALCEQWVSCRLRLALLIQLKSSKSNLTVFAYML